MEEALTFNETTHEYFLGGQLMPSVTQVLHDTGLREPFWSERMEYLRIVGIQTHLACHLLDKGTLDVATVNVEIRGKVKAYRNFKKDTGFNPLASEGRVFNKDYWYAGTLDKAGDLFNDKVIIDLKTGQPTEGDRYQTAGYSFAACPEKATLIKRYALYLRDNGKYKLKEFPNPVDVEIFKAACLIYHAKKGAY